MSGKGGDVRELLAQYVTNLEDDVFAIQNLQGVVGAVMARYSRAETGLRETLLREFVKEDKLKLAKAYKLIERVLIAYGDDSVGELEGAHLSFENISMLATKVIEHRRIGGSPIEQSTRYVRYDFKDPERGYHYYCPESLKDTPGEAVFRDRMDRMFANYGRMWQPLNQWLERHKPVEEAVYDLGDMGSTYADMADDKARKVFERTYRNDLKTKACDILRSFLPLATRANVGLFGNGRFFQHLISKMMTAPLAEASHLGRRAFEELTKVIPHYVKRARLLDYTAANERQMRRLVPRLVPELCRSGRDSGIQLLRPDFENMAGALAGDGPVSAQRLSEVWADEEECGFLASLLFTYVRAPFEVIRQRVRRMSREQRLEIYDTYYGERVTRRDRPERGIEFGYPYTFDLVTEWAVYKDLMRHRMGSIQFQALVPDMGFHMPGELEEAGLGDIARETVALAEELFAYLDAHHPTEREYAFLQGHKMRWLLGMNDRALMHMLELRTTPQGHPNYRRTSQKMHDLAVSLYPDRARRMNFVNHDPVFWSRSDSEARQRLKEQALEGDETAS
ncbi:FAD-dependent thymidylate synthase [Sulfidibacter corallicola]|uniref:FAD-dependent thymidylate synthase n=1 Tax=Sulfidibacter corallicola TaxID=2818388 RepID=A0A8A4TKG8_SULCO|nr:FAD-dependent thymidylate synthase [Sulfidibacter corallicola]QTD49967.1 FAD-dependent thymidylate synthase [Sulfidibacter corallicola]